MTEPTLATEYALRLNTQLRRDQALLDVVAATLEGGRAQPEWLSTALSAFEIPYCRSEAVSYVLNAALAGRLALSASERDWMVGFVDEHLESKERCRCLCMLIQIVNSDEGQRDKVGELRALLEQSIAEIETAWDRVDLVYEISAQIRQVAADLSDSLLETAELESKLSALANGGPIWVYLDILGLAGRALAGLFSQEAYDENDLEEMARIVDRVPSPGHRAVAWSDLALRAAALDKGDLCRAIVRERVEPPLRAGLGDEPLPVDLLFAVAPALYVSNPSSTLEALRAYPTVVRDDALQAVFRFLRTGVPPTEPHSDAEKADRELSHRRVFEICDLADEITRDYTICEIVRSVSRAVSKGSAGDRLTRQQRGLLASRLSRLCDEKLPDTNNIHHDGYLVACRAAIASIERVGKDRWEEIREAARAVPNAADRVLVLAWVAEFIPQGRGRRPLLREAFEMVASLPSAIDRIERWYAIAQAAADEDQSLAQECIRNLMGLGAAQSDKALRDTQRRAIDLAHRIDPEFAADLASAVDDDPARRRVLSQPDAGRVQLRTHLSTRLAQLRSKDGLMEGSDPDPQDDSWWRGADLALGALNAGRARTLDLPATVAVLSGASRLPLSRASSAFAFTVESARRRFHESPEAIGTLRPMFHSLVLAADFVSVFAESLSARSAAERAEEKAADYRAELQPSWLLVGEGERVHALEFLKDWMWGRSDPEVVVVDPFFDSDCMDVIVALSADGRDRAFTVLRGLFRLEDDYEELVQSYRKGWKLLSDNPMPILEVIAIGGERDLRPPFHDRWVVMETAGLAVGTSFNGLGSRLSEIRELPMQRARELYAEMGDLLNRRQYFHKGERLHYRTFTP